MNDLTSFPVTIGVSARHVHLCSDQVQILFGHDLHIEKDLSQGGEYAAAERVSVVSPSNAIQNVRVLGPPRSQTQVELSKTDTVFLGIDVPIRLSGRLDSTPGLTLVGPAGSIRLKSGVIVAARHLHITPMEANRFSIKSETSVEAVMGSERHCTLKNIYVRISSTASLELHIDTDEANTANVSTGDKANIIIPESSSIVSDKSTYICVEDVQKLIRRGEKLRLSLHQKITPAAIELARLHQIIISG